MHSTPMAWTFDDVLLQPRYSDVLPHEVSCTTHLTSDLAMPTPILSAAMDTVSEANLAIAMAACGGLAILHKNMSVTEQADMVAQVKAQPVGNAHRLLSPCLDESSRYRVGAAVGVDAGARARIEALLASGVDAIVIDTAHGHSKKVIEQVTWFKQQVSSIACIVGNIATADAAKALSDVGADVVKVGIGPGSICTTRIVAGVGVPQLYAIDQVANALQDRATTCIADGGIRYSGDIAKAIAAGADAVMLGGLLAATDEAPGAVFEKEGQRYKSYRGMGSLGAMDQAHGSKDRYFQDRTADRQKLVPEGVEGAVPAKGPLEGVIHQLIGGLRSAMGYTGSRTLDALKTAQFVQISAAGRQESHVHHLQWVQAAPNYSATE